jgi:hypothetical protein
MQIHPATIYVLQVVSEVRISMMTDIQQQLSKALIPVDKHYANVVAESMTEIETYPTSFLKHYRIYKVEGFNPNKPVLFYVGFASGQLPYLLTGHVDNYIKLLKADGSVIDKPDIAINYVKTYLEVTRPMAKLFYVICSSQDLEFRPNLDNSESQIKATFLKKYQSVIAPPVVAQTDDCYVVTLYAIEEQSLKLYSVTVNQRNNLEVVVTTLEENLPLVYGL